MLNALVHDPLSQQTLFDRLADAAQSPHAIDRAQVVFVSLFGGAAVFHRDAEAGAEERLLDVVGGECVAGEQHVDVVAADEPAQQLAAACVNNGRSGHDQNFAAALRGTAH